MMKRFEKQADLYARYRPDYPQELFNYISQHLSSRKIAWDCATGSGQAAEHLADYFDDVIATDISQEQLNYAPRKENIRYLQKSAEDSDLPTNYFDLVTVAQAIHWFDIEQFYKEVRRVGKSGSLLAVIGYGMIRVNDDIDPIINDLYKEAFKEYFKENRKYLEHQYQTLPFPFEEIQSPSFENKQNWTVHDLEGYFNSWSAIQKIKTEQNYNPATETIKKVKELVPTEEKFEASFPVFMRLGRIEK